MKERKKSDSSEVRSHGVAQSWLQRSQDRWPSRELINFSLGVVARQNSAEAPLTGASTSLSRPQQPLPQRHVRPLCTYIFLTSDLCLAISSDYDASPSCPSKCVVTQNPRRGEVSFFVLSSLSAGVGEGYV